MENFCARGFFGFSLALERLKEGRYQWQVETREYRAEAGSRRVSPQKARLVLDLIKGRSGSRRRSPVAAFTRSAIAPVIHKLLTSGGGQRQVCGRSSQGIDLDVEQPLREAGLGPYDGDPRMKRIRPAPMAVPFAISAADAHYSFSGRTRGSWRPGDQGRRAGGRAKGRQG